MKKTNFKKYFVIGIIILFVGAGIIPLVSGNWDTITTGLVNPSIYNACNVDMETDWDGVLHVVWVDLSPFSGHNDYNGDKYDIFYRTRSSSGSWSSVELVSSESDRHTKGEGRASVSLALEDSYPDVWVHVAWVDESNILSSGTDADICYKCKKSGDPWPTVTEVVSTDSDKKSDNVSLAVDVNGCVHVVWDDFYDYGNSSGSYDSDIFYRMKDNIGSWGPIELVSTDSTDGSYDPSLDLHNGSIDIHVAWTDLTNLPNYPNHNDNQYDIFYKKKMGTTWGLTELVSTESTLIADYPSLEWDSIHDTVHVAWSDYTDFNGDGHQDIVYKSKPSFGSWPTITEVVSTESKDVAIRPDLGIDSYGRVHVVWVDLTNISDNDNKKYDIFYKSKPGTCSIWSMPTTIVSTDSTDGADRPCIAIDINDSLYIAWDDFTNMSGHIDTDRDIFYKIGAGKYYSLVGSCKIVIRGHGFLDCTTGVYDFDFNQTVTPATNLNMLRFKQLGVTTTYGPDVYLYTHGWLSTNLLPPNSCLGGNCDNIRVGKKIWLFPPPWLGWIMRAVQNNNFRIEGIAYP